MTASPAITRLIITGATGFIGAHAVDAAAARGIAVRATGRSAAKLDAASWPSGVDRVAADLHADPGAAAAALAPGGFAPTDALLHLAWPGLPDYRDPDHVAVHLAADARFLKAAAAAGLRRVVIAGTCLEYGLREGRLSETGATAPTLPYPIAKDALRRWLEAAAPALGLDVAWARLFYMHGPGQNPRSLLAQLDAAIDSGAARFPMSGGEQLRDYLPVETVAGRLVALALTPSARGVFNLGSGAPISVRRLVEQRIAERGASIAPERGAYPYPDYEPMAFWADTSRLDAALAGG
jgi:dTDP-6-deoxy-L-talose 4-dehydrogenase (NAD+)